MIGVSTVGGTTVQETSVLLKASICLDDCVTLLRDKNNNIKDALSAIDPLISRTDFVAYFSCLSLSHSAFAMFIL